MSFTFRPSTAASQVQTSPAIAMIGADLRLLAVTPAFADVLGYAAHELAGRLISALWDANDAVADRDLTRRVLGGELSYFDRVKQCVHKSGHAVRTLLVITPARGPAGETYCAIARLQPVTESTQQTSDSTDQIERIRKAMLW